MEAEDISLASLADSERKKEFMKIMAFMVHNGAALTGIAINNPAKFPDLETAFPTLFKSEAQTDWRVMRARMEAFAAMYNQ